MSKTVKTAILYLIAAIFVAIGLYFVVHKNNYIFFALPAVLGILLLYIFSLDKVLLLIAFVTPLSINMEDSGLALSLPAEPMLFGVLIIFLAKLLYEGKFDNKIASHPISIIIYAMFTWMIFTTITSEIPLVSIKYIISRLWFIVPAYFLCAVFFKDIKNINRFVWFYIAGLIIVIIYTTIHHFLNDFSGQSAHWVMKPFYNDHTAYGAALAIYIVFCAAYIIYPKINRAKRTTAFVAFVLLSVAIILSFCRASWLSIVAMTGVLVCVLLKIKFRWIFIAAVIMIGLFFTFQHQISIILERNDQDAKGNIVEHIQSISNISTDASNLERINRWNSAIRLFQERPVFGWGPGTYQFVYAPYQLSKNRTIISTNAGDGGNAHSEYIGALAEMGIIGSLLVVALVIVGVYKGLTTYKRAKNKESKILVLAATLAIIGYFTHGVLNNFLDTDKLSMPIWSCFAIITAIDLFHADKKDVSEITE